MESAKFRKGEILIQPADPPRTTGPRFCIYQEEIGEAHGKMLSSAYLLDSVGRVWRDMKIWNHQWKSAKGMELETALDILTEMGYHLNLKGELRLNRIFDMEVLKNKLLELVVESDRSETDKAILTDAIDSLV